MIFVMVLTSVMQVSAQGLAKQLDQKAMAVAEKSEMAIPRASEVLEKILSDSMKKKSLTPLDIYPPHYLEWLEKMGDEPMYEMERFDPGASALTAGDQANMAWISPGTFTMGSPTSETMRDSGEVQHTVTLTSGFYIGKYEVTQGEYLAVMGNNPSYFTVANGYYEDLNRPVEGMTWYEATNYCYFLTQQELVAGRIQPGWVFRLPTEAEWEYACRAGTVTAFHFGNAIQGGNANFNTHYEYDSINGQTFNPSPTVAYLERTDTVGNYDPNAWSLYDMHGNVWEYCLDSFDSYPTGSVIDPHPVNTGFRPIRGGHWGYFGWGCRSAQRISVNPAGGSVGTGFRIVLAPTTPQWQTAITTTPSQPTYGNYPTKGSGKDSLIIITHGWINRFAKPLSLSPPDQTWVNSMSNAVQTYLDNHGMNNWQVYGYKWLNNAWKFTAPDALSNAKGEGVNLGSAVSVQGWSHVHLIGHSAGAEVIQEASQWIKAQGATVQCTFLDAYVGNDNAGVATYGNGNDWSDSYFSHDVTGDVTEQPLNHAYNVDVTQLGPKQGITKFRSQTTGQMELCTKTIKYHGWPIDFYMNTITGSGVNGDYAGFGFPLSKEGGGWSSGVPGYNAGNVPAQVLGTADPSCINDISISPPSYPNTTPDFTQLPTIESTTGTIQKWLQSLKLFSGSPAWIATVVSSTNPVNTVSFDTRFTSTNGAQGLLSVLWDDQVIGSIDERIAITNHYSFRFPNAVVNSEHILGFRLDPFTNVQSIVTVTNITLNQVGVSQPFSLAITTSTTNGLPIWELTGQSGFAYGIQASTNLTDWMDIAELINTNGAVRFYDQGATNYPIRFYRGITPQPQ